MTKRLSELENGQKARVVKLGISGDIRHRLSDMGLVNGAEVQMVRVAPLGDPIEIRVKGYDLSLRKEIASEIEVEPLNIPLIKVAAGKTVVVSGFSGSTEVKRRLSDMGLTPGTEIAVIENHYPGPLLINLRGSRLVLGQDLSEQILVIES
jgi:ferrous iron transport protein A